MRVHSRPLSISAALAVVIFGTPALGSDLWVGPGQTYSNIQAAVDAAQNGDVIRVLAGTYTGTGTSVVEFKGKALTIKSENGKNQTFIDGENVRCCVQAAEAAFGTLLQGFTLHNGSSGPVEWGAGLRATNGTITVKACEFYSNHSTNGGGAAFLNSVNATFQNCKISGNSAISAGGGIAQVTDGTLVLEGGTSVRQNSTQGSGGGIYLGNNTTGVFKDTLICSNSPLNIATGPSGNYFTNSFTQIKDICPDIESLLAIAKTWILYEIPDLDPDPGPYQLELVASMGWLINVADVAQNVVDEMIVVDSGLGIIARVELETGEFLGEQFVHEQMGMPTAVEFVDGLAVVADAEMGFFVFDAENGQFLGSFGDGQMMASDLAFADEGSFYASGYNGDLGSVQKWNAYSGELEIEFRDPAMSSAGCMLKRSDDSLLVADEVSAKIHIFDADGTYNGYFGSGEGDESSDIPNVTDMVLSPDGTIYIVTDGGLARYSQGGTFKDEYPMNDESGENVELSKLVFAEPDPVPWSDGDINGDERVNGADLGLMLAAWGPAARGSDADIDGDGQVSGADLGQLLANWTG